jgi:glycine/D-amino acid oxidase-like deaminating enzyme
MNDPKINRRAFLKTVGLAAASSGLAIGCAGRLPRANPDAITSRISPAPKELMPVHVSPDRVVRHVAGLRPYRPSGFVVKLEEVGHKTIIHNYGHGGAGVTLSWGSAKLAVEQALKMGRTRYAVIGCGAVGLATARLLQRRGYDVTIYAKDLPPDTTSNIAGALWLPTSVYDERKVTTEFRTQYEQACRFSYRFFQNMVGAGYGVQWHPVYNLSTHPPAEGIAQGALASIRDLFPETKTHHDPNRFFGYPYAQQYHAMVIEPHIYLNAVLRDFQIAGGKIVVREFANRKDVLALPEPVIVNCTGIGAKDLFHDSELMPIKGQLTVLLPQPEIDYCVIANDQGTLYMFPRSDGIVLGGTFERDVWSLEPNQSEIQRILEGHAKIFRALKRA